jgi:hypothetical protein
MRAGKGKVLGRLLVGIVSFSTAVKQDLNLEAID